MFYWHIVIYLVVLSLEVGDVNNIPNFYGVLSKATFWYVLEATFEGSGAERPTAGNTRNQSSLRQPFIRDSYILCSSVIVLLFHSRDPALQVPQCARPNVSFLPEILSYPAYDTQFLFLWHLATCNSVFDLESHECICQLRLVSDDGRSTPAVNIHSLRTNIDWRNCKASNACR